MIESIQLVGDRIDVYADNGELHIMNVAAIASWSKLLGYTDVVDTVEAIVHVARNGEPPACPVTGENAWTEDYLAVGHVESEREREAFQAREEGRRDDPRSPELRATLAARRANLEAVGATSERDSLTARCQQKARLALGVLDPVKPQSSSRRGRITCEEEPQTNDCEVRSRDFCPEDRRKVRECLADHVELIAVAQASFCHQLTPNEENPIPIAVLEAPEEVPAPALNSMEGLLARYANPDDADGAPPASEET